MTIETVEAARKSLRRRGWLSRVPADFADGLLAGATMRRVAAGEGVCHMADPSTNLFGLADGTASVFVDGGPALASLAFIAHPGWWGGTVALADGTPRRATVIARTPMIYMSIPLCHVEAVARTDRDTWRHIAACGASHFDNLGMLLLAHLHERPETRLLITLRRLYLFNDGDTEFRLSQEELAEMSGLSRKTANRAIRTIVEDGLIATGYGRVRITDPDGIETALSRADLPVWTGSGCDVPS